MICNSFIPLIKHTDFSILWCWFCLQKKSKHKSTVNLHHKDPFLFLENYIKTEVSSNKHLWIYFTQMAVSVHVYDS